VLVGSVVVDPGGAVVDGVVSVGAVVVDGFGVVDAVVDGVVDDVDAGAVVVVGAVGGQVPPGASTAASLGIVTRFAHPKLEKRECRVIELPSANFVFATTSRMKPASSTPMRSSVPE
jgi:hypothetical protein